MDTIALSQQQIAIHQVMDRLIRRDITEYEAAELLKKSIRQIRRLKQKVRYSGVSGLIHGNIGVNNSVKLCMVIV